MNKYIPIIKTGDAEIKALEESPFMSSNENVIPLIELTRGRKKTTKYENGISKVSFPYEKRLDKIKKVFSNCNIAIDLTSDPDLLSDEIYELYSPLNGYDKWLSFLGKLKEERCFKSITPAIVFNWDDNDKDIIPNVSLEVLKLCKEYGSVLYRCDLGSKDCYEELPIIRQSLTKDSFLFVVIDAGYLQFSMEKSATDVFLARIRNFNNILEGYNYQIVISSTSFPNNVTEYGDKETDTIRLLEKDIYNNIKHIYSDVAYSDHATINPKRNDLIVMARGWIPRIDVPINEAVYYYKVRRPKGMSAYKGAYIVAANKAIADVRYPKSLTDLWGIKMINNCAYGLVPASNPSFWISVRMNIHLYQTLNWLNLI